MFQNDTQGLKKSSFAIMAFVTIVGIGITSCSQETANAVETTPKSATPLGSGEQLFRLVCQTTGNIAPERQFTAEVVMSTKMLTSEAHNRTAFTGRVYSTGKRFIATGNCVAVEL